MYCTHVTNDVAIEAEIPAGFEGLDAHQITDKIMQDEMARGPIYGASSIEDMAQYQTIGLRVLHTVSEAVFNREHWKGPFATGNPKFANGTDADQWVAAAAIWFHGDSPDMRERFIEGTRFTAVVGHGYAC